MTQQNFGLQCYLRTPTPKSTFYFYRNYTYNNSGAIAGLLLFELLLSVYSVLLVLARFDFLNK